MRARRILADAFAMITFSTATGMVIELGIAGLTLGQSLQTRLVAIPVNFLTARPYGLYRDWLMKIVGARGEGRDVRKAVTDTIAFVPFQTAVFATNMALAGATVQQILIGCLALAPILPFIGWPYGIYLDFVRRKFKIKSDSLET